MKLAALATLALGGVLGLGCIGPSDQRPGLWLSGETAPFPDDWGFSDGFREVALQVRTPYLLPHSVTIWCASLDGQLYVGARDPEAKRWPGWVERRPNVRLRIGDRIYEGSLALVEDPRHLGRVRSSYARKYDLQDPAPVGSPPIRYWRVAPRS
ncbi:MAG: hypothetical protein ABFS46_22470 [Myxococcota bacterium]